MEAWTEGAEDRKIRGGFNVRPFCASVNASSAPRASSLLRKTPKELLCSRYLGCKASCLAVARWANQPSNLPFLDEGQATAVGGS
jgi:hypothetical protein